MDGAHLLSGSVASVDSKEPRVLDYEQVSHLAYRKWALRSLVGDETLTDWLDSERELAAVRDLDRQLVETRDCLARVFAGLQQTEHRLDVEHTISRILTDSGSFESIAQKLVRAICHCFDWEVGVVWVRDPDADVLRCLAVWHIPDCEVSVFEKDSLARTFSQGVGLPGRIWSSESVVWFSDVTAEANLPRGDIAAAEGLRAGFGFPILGETGFLGVLEFFSREVRQPDERILEAMASLGRQISQYVVRREAEQRLHRQQQELRIAREIQQGFLPKTVPQLPGFEIAGGCLAPHSVGGDCYDFIPMLGPGSCSTGVFLADACGHGIGAALLIAETRAYVRGLAMTCADCGRLLDLTDRCLSHDIAPDKFVTAMLVQLQPNAGSLNYASAGHLPGFVLDARGEVCGILPSTGLPLGIDPNRLCATGTARIGPGELALLITDGVIEASTAPGHRFGVQRTLDVVRRHREEPPGEIVQTLFDSVRDFCNDKCYDDMTAVIIRRDSTGRPQDNGESKLVPLR